MPDVTTDLAIAGESITLKPVGGTSLALKPATQLSAVLGPVTVTFTDESGLSWSARLATVIEYGGLQVGATPAIMLSANLPDGIRGYPYAGTISATNIGGATGAITISVDELPAGLALGDTTTTDGQTYTATISGTLQ